MFQPAIRAGVYNQQFETFTEDLRTGYDLVVKQRCLCQKMQTVNFAQNKNQRCYKLTISARILIW